MPQVQQTIRGNLAADPKFYPARPSTETEPERKAYAELQVYRNRREKQADGSWADSPKGPEKVSAKFFGRDAEIVSQAGFSKGDPVCVAGALGDPEAFTTTDGRVRAQTVILGDTVCIDTMRIAAKDMAHSNGQQNTATFAQNNQQQSIPDQQYVDQYNGFAAAPAQTPQQTGFSM